MYRLLHFWRNFRTLPPTLIEVRISEKALRDNYDAYKDFAGIAVAPVLKSNAYGHGLVEVARVLQDKQAPFLVVDSYHEAMLLRSQGVTTSVLIIGYTLPEVMASNNLSHISFVVTSIEGLQALALANVQASVHIKIDTGIHRQGLLPADVEGAIQLLKNSRLTVEGICSHFADADSVDSALTRQQITQWNAQVSLWRAAFPHLCYWHIAATAGASYTQEVVSNVVRLGSGLYGFVRHQSQTFTLAPALSMHSVLTSVKALGVGESVGYNATFTASVPMRVACVPTGYFEGVDRRLSGQGVFIVNKVVCPILGRVSMNMTTVDVTKCTDARLGTPATVISDRAGDPNSVLNSSALCGMSPLEFLVHIPQHLRRVVV